MNENPRLLSNDKMQTFKNQNQIKTKLKLALEIIFFG